MKKSIILAVVSLLIVQAAAFAADLDFGIFDVRNKIFEESKQLRTSLSSSRDALILTSIFDMCTLTMSQVDAYFSLLGVFDAIKKEELTTNAVDFITGWLSEVKTTSQLNIHSLDVFLPVAGPDTKPHILTIKNYLTALGVRIDSEIGKLQIIRKTAKVKRIR